MACGRTVRGGQREGGGEDAGARVADRGGGSVVDIGRCVQAEAGVAVVLLGSWDRARRESLME